MNTPGHLQQAVKSQLDQYIQTLPKTELYQPLTYFLNLGGKRLRPVLCLLAADAFGGQVQEALKPALAIELFHNFTLIHDDIMDQAALRRGRQTVHEKWDESTAILAGDALLIEAYKLLATAPANSIAAILEVFNTTATEVCEGQQMDMAYENRTDVSIDDYIRMIGLKTSVLLGCSLKIGALLAGASASDCEQIYQFGVNAGIGFQLQDDLLDAFPLSGKFGKEVGGDILANKKTYLLLRAKQKAAASQTETMEKLLSKGDEPAEKVEQMLALFRDLDIPADTQEMIDKYFSAARKSLDQLSIPAAQKEQLYLFLESLRLREF